MLFFQASHGFYFLPQPLVGLEVGRHTILIRGAENQNKITTKVKKNQSFIKKSDFYLLSAYSVSFDKQC